MPGRSLEFPRPTPSPADAELKGDFPGIVISRIQEYAAAQGQTTEELLEQIAQRIRDGESLRSIHDTTDIPISADSYRKVLIKGGYIPLRSRSEALRARWVQTPGKQKKNLQKTLFARYLGLGKEGKELDRFIIETGFNLEETWHDVLLDTEKEGILKTYQAFTRRVGTIAIGAIDRSRQLLESPNPREQQAAEIILFNKVVRHVLTGLRVSQKLYPDAALESEELVAQGIEKAWNLVLNPSVPTNLLGEYIRNNFIIIAESYIAKQAGIEIKPVDSLNQRAAGKRREETVSGIPLETTKEHVVFIHRQPIIDPDEGILVDVAEALTDTNLTEKEYTTLIRRTSATLEEIGREQGVTREAIRQAEARALKKIRAKLREKGYVIDVPQKSKDSSA